MSESESEFVVDHKPSESGRSLGGKVLGFLAVALLLAFIVLMLLPGVGSGPVALRSVCKNNMKQIGLALHAYRDEYGCFPPAYIPDAKGRPFVSWRVLILPYLEEINLYNMYRMDEPWNGPNNFELADIQVSTYRCPESDHGEQTATNYLAIVGDEAGFAGAEPRCGDVAKVALDHTIVIVEVADSGIPWSMPRDLDFRELKFGVNESQQSISSNHRDCALALFGDSHVLALKEGTPRSVVSALCTIDQADNPPESEF